jgi:hypothetical protein
MKSHGNRITFAGRITINQKFIIRQIFDPDFRNAGRGISGNLHIPVVLKSGVGNFHNKKSVVSPNFLRRIVVSAWLQQQNVRFSVVFSAALATTREDRIPGQNSLNYLWNLKPRFYVYGSTKSLGAFYFLRTRRMLRSMQLILLLAVNTCLKR